MHQISLSDILWGEFPKFFNFAGITSRRAESGTSHPLSKILRNTTMDDAGPTSVHFLLPALAVGPLTLRLIIEIRLRSGNDQSGRSGLPNMSGLAVMKRIPDAPHRIFPHNRVSREMD
jgi:hypothetical protein